MARAALFAFMLLAAAGAARADTLLRYNGPAFSSISCNRPCHFTRISFTVALPGSVAGAGPIAFCYGFADCANPVSRLRFSDGEGHFSAANEADFQFSGMLTLDATRAVTNGFVAGAESNTAKRTLIYMDFGSPSGGDSLGGELRGANVDASATAAGQWTVTSVPARP